MGQDMGGGHEDHSDTDSEEEGPIDNRVNRNYSGTGNKYNKLYSINRK